MLWLLGCHGDIATVYYVRGVSDLVFTRIGLSVAEGYQLILWNMESYIKKLFIAKRSLLLILSSSEISEKYLSFLIPSLNHCQVQNCPLSGIFYEILIIFFNSQV